MTLANDISALVRPERQDKLAALDWLVSDSQQDRRTGRSFMLACAFLKKAVLTPGVSIKVFDHHQQNRSQQIVTRTIESLVSRMKQSNPENWANVQIEVNHVLFTVKRVA